jgi:hypothetical protein
VASEAISIRNFLPEAWHNRNIAPEVGNVRYQWRIHVKRAGSASKGRLVVSILWIAFLVLWYRVYTITSISDFTDSLGYLATLTAAYCVVVTAWVAHNINIYRKKGPRHGVRVLNYGGTHDALQNYILNRADLKRTQAIMVRVSDGQKHFLVSASTPQQEPELVGSR